MAAIRRGAAFKRFLNFQAINMGVFRLASSEPVIAAKEPFEVTLKPGKVYMWCACGLSSKQPFCDGSHKRTALKPVKVVAEESGDPVHLCGCKQTSSHPFCDGTHATHSVQSKQVYNPNT